MIFRKKLEEIEQWISARQYIIIKGARRVGKTTLLREIEKNIQTPSAFLVCDSLDFSQQISTPNHLIQLLKTQYQFSENSPFTLFLDEFQYIQNAGLFLKNLYDQYPHLKIIASGSSALEITKNTEFLTGRSIEFSLSPFSFKEFLLAKEGEKFRIPEKKDDFKEWYFVFSETLERYFEEYLTWGGYPEVVLAHSNVEKKKLLESYIEKYIQKDVAQFLHVENIRAFNALLRILADDIGNMINENELSSTLGITNKTVKKYMDIIEGTYIIRRIPPFYTNVRSEVSKMKKGYFCDLGVRNTLLKKTSSFSFQENKGSEVENIVENTLFLKQKEKPKYYRTIGGSEIDFIAEKDYLSVDLIEVKYRNNPKKIRALIAFAQKYSEKKCTKRVITKNIFEEKDGVEYIPASIFCLYD